jgi:hypothetical protein
MSPLNDGCLKVRGIPNSVLGVVGLIEGGFAHVYVVRLKEKMKLADGSVGDVACLKRVIAPDKEALGIVRTEVDTMVEKYVHFELMG